MAISDVRVDLSVIDCGLDRAQRVRVGHHHVVLRGVLVAAAERHVVRRAVRDSRVERDLVHQNRPRSLGGDPVLLRIELSEVVRDRRLEMLHSGTRDELRDGVEVRIAPRRLARQSERLREREQQLAAAQPHDQGDEVVVELRGAAARAVRARDRVRKPLDEARHRASVAEADGEDLAQLRHIVRREHGDEPFVQRHGLAQRLDLAHRVLRLEPRLIVT